ncbi:tubulin binding cofactor C, partial [Helicosporidium sp. ATCC 50920]
VYLLDHTAEVEVSNCHDCRIFIGPVDGPAIFDSCSNCRIAVACQQFQAKNCTNIDFELYCATQPSLHSSHSITLSPWGSSYAGVEDHFEGAHLDPRSNQWNKVYDASAADDAASADANFALCDAPSESWVIPAFEVAPPPGAQGNPFGKSSPAANGNGHGAAAGNGGGSGIPDSFLEDGEGRASPPAPSAAQTPVGRAWEAELQARLDRQAKEEGEKKVQLQEAAASYLDQFYQERETQKNARKAAARSASEAKGPMEAGAEGDNEWERTLSLIDFNASPLLGTDLSRFKAVLMSCKKRGSAAPASS